MLEDIIVFGRGKYFKSKAECLQRHYRIIGFLDNLAKEPEYCKEFDCMVYHPRQLSKMPDCPIMVMSIYFIEMYQQLLDLGVPCKRIKFGQKIDPFYDNYEKLMFSDGEMLEASEKGLYYKDAKGEVLFNSKEEYDTIKKKMFYRKNPEIKLWRNINCEPVDRNFGAERGKAVDRVYIERFIDAYKKDIHGTVMEVQDNRYIKQFGENRVEKELILHVKGWGGANVIKGNFATGEGLEEKMVDCLICTQTLQYIYDLKSTAKNIYRILKDNGVALITVPGIKSLSEYHDANWGEYWSFTKRSLYSMFAEEFGEDHVEVKTYGNVKVTMAYLYGLCAEDLQEEDFSYNDEAYPFIVAARIKKH